MRGCLSCLGSKMRGKLKVPVRAADVWDKARDSAVKFRQAAVESGTSGILPVRRSAPWIAGVLAVLAAGSALPQGNIDAGKSPAQLFADTCSNCHRRPSELKRGASASFLRQHYTPGSQEAAAMANYLASIPADPRAGKDKAKGPAQEKEKAKPQQQAQERPPERPQERPKAQPPAGKGKRPELGKSEPPAETPPETRVEAASVPKLEPFEE
jgi:mono/diheme cytochrome c family protein